MNGMSRQVDGPRSMADAESAKEYQDDDFSDELGLSYRPILSFLQAWTPIVL